STLITSAPRSPRICPAQGPASTRDRSRTRIWDNADMLESCVGWKTTAGLFHQWLAVENAGAVFHPTASEERLDAGLRPPEDQRDIVLGDIDCLVSIR